MNCGVVRIIGDHASRSVDQLSNDYSSECRATRTGDPLESFHGIRGWFTWSFVPLYRVSKPLVLLTRRMARVHIVLGRYNGTVVAWARLLVVETPCHGADEQRAKLLHGYSFE